ncbi:PAS domain S-box protein [Acinetobacter sp. C_4_1]|uniref:MASE3 domain-containing protein n=1 Tax=unclassified Acinetobacter TaxID=196816 RepID=UPI0021B7BEC2|nr:MULTISPECIES: MASE3 domain-containing protein [unclassified Acinetobacter]MCT8088194.1 PAS domain S-box protein [Acinetobacter sp. F_3_1]MCT8097563.1 PAS domain S-box protein [Acinetobacter sp. C_3_1]MCT8100656.1 PAS domain S-box protein [Acinetobacter sp. C_4_1]MCT8134057.1 PAS domain S-box protein [Acinetobacter sp. T_3_1]
MPKSSRDLFSPDVFDLKSFISPYMMIIPPTIFALLIWWTNQSFGFLFTHTVAELISIIIALTALIVTVVSRHFTKNYFVVFIAIAIGWCGFIDLFHTLLYKGMQILPVDSANQATQLWIGARLLQAFAMLAAPFMLTRAIKPVPLNLFFGLLSAGIVTAVMLGFFPTAFVDGQGLTPFKIYSEYLIIVVLTLALILVWHRREYLSTQLTFGVSLSMLTMMASEFTLTQYVSVYADANLLGHILKVYSYWFIYMALVESTIKEPFSMLSKAASTYDTIPDPTYIVSSSQTIQQVNLAAARLHGIAAAQLTGRSVHELVHDPRVKAEDCPVCSRLQQAPQEFLTQLSLPDRKTVECHVAPFAERLGQKPVWVMVVHDITDRQLLLQDVQKRVKEVRCLNQINQLCNNTHTGMTELLQKAMEIIPSGFSSPERIHLRIDSDWGIFGTELSAQTPCLQSVFGNDAQKFGSLTIWYAEAPDMPAFLDEEQSLIDHITSQITDVYIRLQSQARVARLTYLYQLLSETNRVIAHSQNQKQLLTELQQVLLKLGGFAKILIALKADDQADSPLVLQFHHNISANILPALQIVLQQDQNPPLKHVKNTSPDVDVYSYTLVNDPDKSVSPEYRTWIHYLKQEQIRQAALTPLLLQGHFWGLVGLYTTGQVEFDQEQIQLLQNLSRDISFALERFAAEQRRQTAETYSQQMEQRFQQVFLQSPVPMHIISMQDERILAVNLAYEKWLGYSLDDFQNREAWLKKVAPDAEQRQLMQQNWQAALQLAKQGKQVQFPEITLLAKDGSQRIAQRTLAIVGNDAILAWTDLTAIRQTEQALRDSEQRFRGMVEHTVVGMYVIRGHHYLYVNPSYSKMLGWSAEELIGHSLQEFHDISAEKIQLEEGKLLGTDHPTLSYTVPARHKNGQIREFALHARSIIWDDGLPAAIVMAQDITEQKQAQEQIAKHVKQLEATMYGTLQAVATMVEMRDPYTGGHERRVGLIASAIAKEMGWDEKRCMQMEEIGLVHDIGKISIPSEILTKPTRLTYLEMEMMKGHAQAGYDILKDVPFNIPIAEIIGQHHERMDGTGYPKGLKGDEIHPEARILTVADVIESMASHRPYRAALGVEVALAEILRGRGTIYDAEVCDAAVRLINEKGYVLPS